MIGLGCLISLNTQQPYLVAYAHASRLLVDPINRMETDAGRVESSESSHRREPDDGRTFAKTRKQNKIEKGSRAPSS